MREVVIIDAARTPTGSYGGNLKSKSATELASLIIQKLVERNKIDTESIDHVLMGCTLQNAENSYASRLAMIKAGLSYKTPAVTVNRLCGSALEAINQAAQNIMLGLADICIAGGMESMTNAPYLSYKTRWGARLNHIDNIDGLVAVLTDPMLGYHMGVTAENIAEKYGISRQEQDEFAVWSHQKAVKALAEGRFDREIIPVEVKKRKEMVVIKQDEGPRENISVDTLKKLKTVFKKDGTVTAGNASSLNDAASAVILMSKVKADELGLKPRAKVIAQAVVGVPPEIMGIGPAYAIPKVLDRAGLELEDIDIIECNEAFAAQSIAVDRELKFDHDKLNVNGGAIALGHPLGATGAILFTKVLYELERTDKRFGLISLCIGGGQGIATIVDRKI